MAIAAASPPWLIVKLKADDKKPGFRGGAITMPFRSYVPRAPLCEFVSDFWLSENYEGEHQRELILPSGTFEIVFNLQEDELRIYSPAEPQQCHRFAGALVSGPYSGSFMSDAAEDGPFWACISSQPAPSRS